MPPQGPGNWGPALIPTRQRWGVAETSASTATGVDPREASAWLRDLPVLRSAADDSGRRLLTEALFEKVEALGGRSVTFHPTPDADPHGRSDAFGTLRLLLNAGRASSTDGRGERIGAAGSRLIRGCTVVIGGDRARQDLNRTA